MAWKKTSEEIIEKFGVTACPECGAAMTPEDAEIRDFEGNIIVFWTCPACGYKTLLKSNGRAWGLVADKSWVDEHLDDIKAWQESHPSFCSRCGIRARMHPSFSNQEILLCEQCADHERLYKIEDEEKRGAAKSEFWDWSQWAANPDK